ncbi:deoxyribonuclease [Heterostelium album PN500]|uniref:Deoxyribonuclease n=1 Tax=Heterostelium pallidum (strain ATCC 26659 / Pp 5 / PN500) TaxID=670386 RepID=D3B972_HETP5|nr:deoxyribonuclease [Heterostelium album PN500]EFA82111.1 deoxyribonuclease [Heterostelium album PN500]|eukprot:XP_020434228.1 deoxyribonuclease [Heterostelium album PN500]
MKFIDIGVNLTDDMYQGIYHGKAKHQADLQIVLERAWNNGLEKIMITSGRIEEVKQSLSIIEQYDNKSNRLFTTIGVHPTRCSEFIDREQEYIDTLLELYTQNKDKIVAIGEFGLDYDRLEFCPKETQLKYFELQFKLVEATKLPLFLHLRSSAAFNDFVEVIKKYRHTFTYGVVHSFDGTIEEAKQLIELGLHIGINGCSLKTEENLKSMATIPSDKLLIETDAPWCDIRKTHSGYQHITTTFESVKKEKYQPGKCVQARNEPCYIVNVLEVIAGYRKENKETLANTIYETTKQIYFPTTTTTSSQ